MNYYALKQAFNQTEDGTYDLNGNPISFPKGWQVSFERPDDTYTEDQFNHIVGNLAEYGQVCIGVWGGVKEISIHSDSFRRAAYIALAHNQDAIWGWELMNALSRYEILDMLQCSHKENRAMFKVIANTKELATRYTPSHHTTDRNERYEVVKALGGRPRYSLIVDTGHPNGLEVHTILDSGVVVIGNLNSKKLITWLIARPAQITRYGISEKALIDKAREHQEQGLNQ